jgi:hypothetical protein
MRGRPGLANDGGSRRRRPGLRMPWLAAALAALAMAPGAAPAAAQPAWLPIGPYGGGVSVLAGDSGGTLYAGTFRAGVFRSDDGTTWTPARTGLPPGAILDLAADQVVRGRGVAITTGGVATSADGGASWSAVVLRGSPTRLATSAAAHLTFYAFGVPGASRAAALHRSDDGGSTWVPVASDLPSGTVFLGFVADPLEAGVLYGATPQGMVYRSTSFGVHWTGVQAENSHVGLGALVISPARTLYALPVSFSPLLTSTDRGVTWTPLPSPANALFTALAADPASPSVLIGTGSVLPILSAGPFHGTFKSTDGGQTWTELDTAPALDDGLAPEAPTSALIAPSPNGRAYVGTAGGPGVVASQDGGATWSLANQGLAAATVAKITPDPFSPATLYAGLDLGLARSGDRGTTWAAANVGLTSLAALGPEPVHDIAADPSAPAVLSLTLDPRVPATLYAATLGGGAFALDLDAAAPAGVPRR